MKKIFTIIVMTAACLTILRPVNLSAAEISAGATTWYSWWDFNNSKDTNNNTEFDPALLYGPALSLKISEDFNLTFVYLYGKFDMKEESFTTKMSRSDSDLALNYRLNSIFKIFAGAKVMSYKMTNFGHNSKGPGAGVSAVIPLDGNFFLLGNLSALYLWGKDDNKDEEESFEEYGYNSNLSLAYYIPEASVTINAGGRYQYFKTVYDDQNNGEITHKFYGMTLSATYTFSL